MILRAGLLKRSEGLSFDAFDHHWLHIHGPLASAVPGLRAYTQNHIVAQELGEDARALHRVDGISQLWFDDIEAMVHAVKTPEQGVCIEDVKRFLSYVTLTIQRPGEVRFVGPRDDARAKLMVVLLGDPAASDDYGERLERSVRDLAPLGVSFRVNPVIDRSHVVDPSVATGEPVVGAMAEVWFNGREDMQRLLAAKALAEDAPKELSFAAAFAVDERRLVW